MRVLKVLPIRKAKSKFARKRTILMLQLRDFRKRKGELKRLLELHKVKIADEGGHKEEQATLPSPLGQRRQGLSEG